MNLLTLAWTMFLYTVMTFGNGPLLIPLLHQDYVLGRGVISEDQLLYAFTIARVTPGQANLYVASIGYMLFGLTGAVVAMAAILVPGYLMIPFLKFYQKFRDNIYISHFTKGLVAVSVGLIFATALNIGKDTLHTPLAWVVFAATIVMIQFFKWNTFLALFLASLIGIAGRLIFAF